jgi:hypothetical protein
LVRKHGRLVLIRLGIALLLFRPTIAAAQAERDHTNNAPHVRVLSTQGVVREGRLVLLTSSDAILLTNGFVESLPLEEVRRINRVTHGARNFFLAAALSGLVVATASCSSSTDPGECWPQASVVFIGLGAAAGTAIGALYDEARRSSSILYAAPDQVRTVDRPAVMVAAGSGGVLRRHDRHVTAPAFQAGVQFPLSRITSLEVEAMHWSWHRIRDIGPTADDAWRTLSFSSNVSWRFGTPAAAATIAIGAGVQRSTLQESLCVRDCDPLPLGRGFATYAVDVSALALFGGGVEGAITRRLIGFGTVRAVAGKESGVSAFAGIRVPFGRRSILVSP